MIRAVRYLVAVTLATIWYGGRVIVAALLGVEAATGFYDRMQHRYGQTLLRITGITVITEGADRVPANAPVVYVSNHASWVDIWVLLVGLPGRLRFVFKKELLRVPLLGRAITSIGHIAVDRKNRTSAFAAYDGAAEQIRQGTSAVVFVEGTRSRTGKLQPFKKGPFVLAIAAQVPVVPVFCDGTFDRLPKGSVAPKTGIVTLRFGEPIPTAGLHYDERDQVADRARAAMLALGAVE